MPEEIAPGVLTLDHRVVEGKNVVVFGGRGALAIDCGMDAAEGQASLDLIRARSNGRVWLAMTHGHGDHAMGSGCFSGISDEVFAHAAFAGNLRRHLERSARPAASADARDGASGAHVARPTVTFRDEMRLDVGGRTVRFLHTPGHSADSACAYVEEDRILIGGDTVVTCIVPAFGDGDSRELEESIRKLIGLEAETVVAGHGPIVTGAGRVRDQLTWLAEYIAATRAAVERTVRGERDEWIEAALEEGSYERLVGRRLEVGPHDNAKRHRATVAKLVDEAVTSANQTTAAQ